MKGYIMKTSQKILQSSLLLIALLITSVAQPMKRNLDAQEKPKSKTTLILKKKSTTQQVSEAPVNPQPQQVINQEPQPVTEITEDQIADIVNSIPIASLNTVQDCQPPYGEYFFNSNTFNVFGIQTPPLEEDYSSYNPSTPINVSSPQIQNYGYFNNFVSNQYGYGQYDHNILELYQNGGNSPQKTQQAHSSSIKLYGSDVDSDQAIAISLSAVSHSITLKNMLNDYPNMPIPIHYTAHTTVEHVVHCLNLIENAYDSIMAYYDLQSYVQTNLTPQESEALLCAANFLDIKQLCAIIQEIQTLQVLEQSQEVQEDSFINQAISDWESHTNQASPQNINNHTTKNTQEKSYQCQYCEQLFTVNNSLTTHQKPNGLFKCPFYGCDKQFNSSACLKFHKKTHGNLCVDDNVLSQSGKSFQCEVCKKLFTTRQWLINHQKPNNNMGLITCDFNGCNKQFPSSACLEFHKESHEKSSSAKKADTSEKCYVCGQEFKNFSVFVAHVLREHYDEGLPSDKPYKCDQCELSFAKKSNLKVHRMIHTGDKPFKCDQCELSFARKEGLKDHQVTHTGEKPYQCKTCGKAFTQKDGLRAHQKPKSGTGVITCDFNGCDKQFPSSTCLKFHKKTHKKTSSKNDTSIQSAKGQQPVLLDNQHPVTYPSLTNTAPTDNQAIQDIQPNQQNIVNAPSQTERDMMMLYGCDVGPEQAIKISLQAINHCGTLKDIEVDHPNEPIAIPSIAHATVKLIVGCLNTIIDHADNTNKANMILSQYAQFLPEQASLELAYAAKYFDFKLLCFVLKARLGKRFDDQQPAVPENSTQANSEENQQPALLNNQNLSTSTNLANNASIVNQVTHIIQPNQQNIVNALSQTVYDMMMLYGSDVGPEQAIEVTLKAASHSGILKDMLDNNQDTDFSEEPIPFTNTTHETVKHIVHCLNLIDQAQSAYQINFFLSRYISLLSQQALYDLAYAAQYLKITPLGYAIQDLMIQQQQHAMPQQMTHANNPSVTSSEKSSFQCKFCNQVCLSENKLVVHELTHKGEKKTF